MNIEKLKKEYNQVLTRYRKASKYMDCYHLAGEELRDAVAEREQFIPKVQKILLELNLIYGQLTDAGAICKDVELLEGFGHE